MLQVTNSSRAKAENTTLQNELSALQDQLSASTSQLEAEQATSGPQMIICLDTQRFLMIAQMFFC